MAGKVGDKASLIQGMRVHDTDTGSAEVQVALLTKRIEILNKHFESHAKDFSSRRGLTMLLAQRRSQLDYLHRKHPERYESLIARLGLRK
jgi:small subunit ribosomal protein S15